MAGDPGGEWQAKLGEALDKQAETQRELGDMSVKMRVAAQNLVSTQTRLTSAKDRLEAVLAASRRGEVLPEKGTGVGLMLDRTAEATSDVAAGQSTPSSSPVPTLAHRQTPNWSVEMVQSQAIVSVDCSAADRSGVCVDHEGEEIHLSFTDGSYGDLVLSASNLGAELDLAQAQAKYQGKSGRLRLIIPMRGAGTMKQGETKAAGGPQEGSPGQCITTTDGVRVWTDEGNGREYRETKWVYKESSTSDVHLSLLSRTQFFAHRISHACLELVAHLKSEDVRGKSVFELGCGAALPSIMLARLGAVRVVASDFPDENMLANARHNCIVNGVGERVCVVPHQWGTSADPILGENGGRQFDLVIMADLLYELEHAALIDSLEATLRHDGRALVAFQIHDSSTEPKLWAFFDLARTRGFKTTVISRTLAKPVSIWSDPVLDGTEEQAVHLLCLSKA